MNQLTHIEYVTGDLLLEVDVTWNTGKVQRVVVPALLPMDLDESDPNTYAEALRIIRPFVNALRHRDPLACAEIRRALEAMITCGDVDQGIWRWPVTRAGYYDPHSWGQQ